MAEYIDKQKAIEIASGYCHPANIAAELAKLPAADVRPVVTCADCKHWDADWVPNYAKENEHFCPIVTLTTRNDWYCADGEKREES